MSAIHEGCFVTKKTGSQLKTAHWVNPVRNDPSLKHRVEHLLRELCVVPKNFEIDQPWNLTPLDRNLHYTMDKLGFFAITCSKATLTSLISVVERENSVWQYRSEKGFDYYRYFDWDKPAVTDATYELVLLHPGHFLQGSGSPFTVFSEDGDALSGKMYVLSPDGALREGPDNDQPRLPAFTTSRARAPRDMLLPFLVILNAEIAFRRFKRQSHAHALCDEYIELIDLTLDLVDKIYYKPLMVRYQERLTEFYLHYPNALGADFEDNEAAALPQKASNSRMGIVVGPPGPLATHEDIVEYNQYLLSGCDYQDDDSDSDEEGD